MVTLSIRELSDAIHEQEGAAKVGELKDPGQVVIGYDRQFSNLASKSSQVQRAKRPSSALTGGATSPGKHRLAVLNIECLVFVGHGHFSIAAEVRLAGEDSTAGQIFKPNNQVLGK